MDDFDPVSVSRKGREMDGPGAEGGDIVKRSKRSEDRILHYFPRLIASHVASLENESDDDDCGFKNCQWSPDGFCVLTARGRRLSVFEERSGRLVEAVSASEAEPVYGYSWYPLMDSDKPETCCFASISRSSPVHLWDAYQSRRLRGSYTLESEFGEPVWGLSVSVSDTSVFAGLKSCVYVWDIERPGRPLDRRKTLGRSKNGVSGLVSCFAVSPSPLLKELYAVGTYSGHVAAYSSDNRVVFKAKAQASGVTQIRYSSCGTFLWAGGRRSRELLCWDLRAGDSKEPYWRVPRECRTNAHIQFDLINFDESLQGPLVLSGSTEERGLTCYALKGGQAERVEMGGMEELTGAHSMVNGVSLNPWNRQLAVSTGHRSSPQCKALMLVDEDEDQEDVKESPEERTVGLYVYGSDVEGESVHEEGSSSS